MIKKNKGFRVPRVIVKTTYRSLHLILSAFSVFLVVFLLLATISFSERLDIERVQIDSPFTIDNQSVEKEILNILSSRYLYSFSKSNKLIYPKAEIRANILKEIPRASNVILDVDQSVLSVRLIEREKNFIWCDDENCFFVDSNGFVFQSISREKGVIGISEEVEVVEEEEDDDEEEKDIAEGEEEKESEDLSSEVKEEERNDVLTNSDTVGKLVEEYKLIVLNDTFTNRTPKVPSRFDIIDFDKLNNILMYLEDISINVVSIDVVRRKDFDNQVILNIDKDFSLYVNLERDTYTTTRDIYISLFNVFNYESEQDNISELDYIDVRFDNGIYFSPQSIIDRVNN